MISAVLRPILIAIPALVLSSAIAFSASGDGSSPNEVEPIDEAKLYEDIVDIPKALEYLNKCRTCEHRQVVELYAGGYQNARYFATVAWSETGKSCATAYMVTRSDIFFKLNDIGDGRTSPSGSLIDGNFAAYLGEWNWRISGPGFRARVVSASCGVGILRITQKLQ